MQINIIYVGNIKDKYLSDAVKEYEKRLGAYAKVQNVELKDEKLPENPSDAEVSAAIAKEGEKILAAIPPRSYKIAMCIEGKQMSSEDFADQIGKIKDNFPQITFIIGGAFGLSEKVKAECNLRLSISKMTFTHRMARVLLVEQIYRAMNILGGGKYHK